MSYAVGGIIATLYVLLGALLLFSAIQVTELALCSDPAGIAASGEDDCIDTSSAGRAIGFVLAYCSVIAAFATVGLGVFFARRRERGGQLAAAAIVTPVLALAAVFFLPISF